MNNRFSRILIFFFVCFSFWARAQNFTVHSSAKDVVEKQVFEVVYTVENAKGAEFSPPDFSPARVAAGPFDSRKTSIVNGVSSFQRSYTYQLTYSKAGKYTIPKAKIKYGSYTKSSKPLTINVLKAGSKVVGKGEEIFLEKKMPDTSIFVGEQFLIDHHLNFSNLNIRGVYLSDEFNASPFLQQSIKSDEQNKVVQKNIDGKLLNTAWVSRLSFFSLRSGNFEMPDMVFEVDVKKQRSRRDFFGRMFERKVLQTDGFNIEVKPLPDGAPESFTGAVGRLTATSSIDKGQLEVGKEILVQLEMLGNGVMDQVKAPRWTQDGLEIFDPKLISEQKGTQNGELVFIKKYEYIVIPQKGGKIRLEIPYSFFDSETEKYVEKISKSTLLDIKGDASSLQDATAKSMKGTQTSTSTKWYNQLWFWGILVALAGLLIYYFTNRKPVEKVEELTEEEAALITATRQLAGAKSILDSGNTSKYWETLESSLRIYLEEKIGIGTTAYSMERVEQFWGEKKIEESYLTEYKQMVEKINLARYAGQSISDMQNLYKQAEQWIVQVEKQKI